MILVVDNRDSFVHNLARYVRELGFTAAVRRSDVVTLTEIESSAPSHVILSPGPCSPAQAGLSVAIVRRFAGEIPILGVCLGHQCIAEACGAAIVRASRPRHGKLSPIVHDGTGLFTGLPSPFSATRYHSLAVDPATVPDWLRVTARAADDGEIMAVEHRTQPLVGLQFHPESAASEFGYAMLDRFLRGNRSRLAALPRHADGLRSRGGSGGGGSEDPPLPHSQHTCQPVSG
jgi:anthranilate synthase/aminodeoxychorismate synthase-like glutamine amidotransferase